MDFSPQKVYFYFSWYYERQIHFTELQAVVQQTSKKYYYSTLSSVVFMLSSMIGTTQHSTKTYLNTLSNQFSLLKVDIILHHSNVQYYKQKQKVGHTMGLFRIYKKKSIHIEKCMLFFQEKQSEIFTTSSESFQQIPCFINSEYIIYLITSVEQNQEVMVLLYLATIIAYPKTWCSICKY